MSPRIAWFNLLGFGKSLVRMAIALGVLLAIAYGIKQAIEHTFHRNPDFRLQVIDLSPNDVLDEAGLVEHLGIDLASNIFDFDVAAMRERLLEISAIESAKVERELPGTLVFKIKTRKPIAWIASPEEGHSATRAEGSLLVDRDNFTYPCPTNQLQEATQLPVFILAADPEHPVRIAKKLAHPQYRHCARLLTAFRSSFPEDISMIDSISQEKEWSLDLKTRPGTIARFGLGDHNRQLDYLARALHHARRNSYEIATINLIPKRNVPITVRREDTPPRAIPVSEEMLSGAGESSQADNDLRSLLNRN